MVDGESYTVPATIDDVGIIDELESTLVAAELIKT